LNSGVTMSTGRALAQETSRRVGAVAEAVPGDLAFVDILASVGPGNVGVSGVPLVAQAHVAGAVVAGDVDALAVGA
jgi:hypothetical protein